MRVQLTALASGCLLALGYLPAVAKDYCSRDGVEKFTAADCAALFADAAPATRAKLKRVATVPVVKTNVAPPPGSTATAAVDITPAQQWINDHVFLRRSMKDLGSFSSPSALDKAAGAAFSWSRDGV